MRVGDLNDGLCSSIKKDNRFPNLHTSRVVAAHPEAGGTGTVHGTLPAVHRIAIHAGLGKIDGPVYPRIGRVLIIVVRLHKSVFESRVTGKRARLQG